MLLGYGTYGMKSVGAMECVRGLRAIGYESIELTVAEGWPTHPKELNAQTRRELRTVLQGEGFPAPAILALLKPCATGEDRKELISEFEEACRLASDLNFGNSPAVITSTVPSPGLEWVTDRDVIRTCLTELADIAARAGVIYAVEPHVGGAFDAPGKADWLVRTANHPNLKLNFDISHFSAQDMDTAECIRLCAPHAVHCHVKDATVVDGQVRFHLPGGGGFDYVDFFRRLQGVSFKPAVTVEVSAMVWKDENYDPWTAARRCWQVLDTARRKAGVK